MSDWDLISAQAAEPSLGIQVGNTVLVTHGESQCSGEYCCIHHPSNHPLQYSPLNWRGDRGLMERICIHGVGHPDPDDIAHKRRVGHPDPRIGVSNDDYADGEAVHGCCMAGCCARSLV